MKKNTTLYNSFQRWTIINSSANYIADMLKTTNSSLNLEKVIISISSDIIDIDWLSKRQMQGLKRDVIKNIKAIEERDVISFKLGNLKEVNKIDLTRLEV